MAMRRIPLPTLSSRKQNLDNLTTQVLWGVILRSGRAPGGTFIFDPQASHPPQPAAGADFFELFFFFHEKFLYVFSPRLRQL